MDIIVPLSVLLYCTVLLFVLERHKCRYDGWHSKVIMVLFFTNSPLPFFIPWGLLNGKQCTKLCHSQHGYAFSISGVAIIAFS